MKNKQKTGLSLKTKGTETSMNGYSRSRFCRQQNRRSRFPCNRDSRCARREMCLTLNSNSSLSKVCVAADASSHKNTPPPEILPQLTPRIVVGETCQGVLTCNWIPSSSVPKNQTVSYTRLALGTMLKYVPYDSQVYGWSCN